VATPRIAILADDLIWATRLAALVRAVDAEPVAAGSLAALDAAVSGGVDRAIVDLTARTYDAVEAIASGVRAGAAILAVGQHDDVELRRRALAAGAGRFVPYRLLADASGPAIVASWSSGIAAPGEPTPETVRR
jgi:hypothetical protein